ncbi:MAG: hypothetical protein M3Q12_04265 [Pseudomonadota bacterium]|uniref:hypothetical protein n=1 Tax=Polaromonas sp. TaxID=1869339 RepID=UPI0017C97617|nr:hypothetical protein [Polaromonas sp.]MBA3592730.1 hypothetical protein [Polaromonas sp.]MDQ3271371.1 hypothetical protein [Pseudomonadota bacterium]
MHPAPNINRQTFAALLLACLCAGVLPPAYAQLPTVTTRTEIWIGNGQPIDLDAHDRAQWEYWQMQREQQRRQLELTRQQDAQLRQSQESIGERALREQAQRNGTWVPAPPGLSDQERIWRDQQQMQREAWRQQRAQTRHDNQRIRQESETFGQRALREQAQNRREQGRMTTSP